MKIIFSAGDVNGVGLETFFKMLRELPSIWYENRAYALAVNRKTLEEYAVQTDISLVFKENYFEAYSKKIQIIDCENYSPVKFGEIDKFSALHAFESIEKSVELLKSGDFDALVTLPINKEAMKLTGWSHPGHTEMIAQACCVADPLMILLTGNFRVALATIHVPLKNVTELITKERIFELVKKFNNSLRYDFGIAEPKIAALGLNPHAGENGTIGNEERDTITPAIRELRKENIKISGPFPADGFFARESWRGYDGVFAMYHDQGLIPLKMEARGGGVNFTAGLSIVRTSPDHGTGFDIAGKGLAGCKSLMSALETAIQIVENRNQKI